MAVTIERERLQTIPLVEERPWVALSGCRDIDAGVFFGEASATVLQAKRVCAGCPVVDDCLDYALEIDVRFGVWGGMTTRERMAILRDFTDAEPA